MEKGLSLSLYGQGIPSGACFNLLETEADATTFLGMRAETDRELPNLLISKDFDKFLAKHLGLASIVAPLFINACFSPGTTDDQRVDIFIQCRFYQPLVKKMIDQLTEERLNLLIRSFQHFSSASSLKGLSEGDLRTIVDDDRLSYLCKTLVSMLDVYIVMPFSSQRTMDLIALAERLIPQFKGDKLSKSSIQGTLPSISTVMNEALCEKLGPYFLVMKMQQYASQPQIFDMIDSLITSYDLLNENVEILNKTRGQPPQNSEDSHKFAPSSPRLAAPQRIRTPGGRFRIYTRTRLPCGRDAVSDGPGSQAILRRQLHRVGEHHSGFPQASPVRVASRAGLACPDGRVQSQPALDRGSTV